MLYMAMSVQEGKDTWNYLIGDCYNFLLLGNKPPQNLEALNNTLLLSPIVLWGHLGSHWWFSLKLLMHLQADDIQSWRHLTVQSGQMSQMAHSCGWHLLWGAQQGRGPELLPLSFPCGLGFSQHDGQGSRWHTVKASLPRGRMQKLLNYFKNDAQNWPIIIACIFHSSKQN